jgi:hypothetical protein
MIEPIAELYRRGSEIVVIGLDGIPSSGVRYTGKANDWGGRPHVEEGDYEVVEGMGVDGRTQALSRVAKRSVAASERDVARLYRLGRNPRPAGKPCASSTNSSGGGRRAAP